MVAISLYRGNLHRVPPDIPRRWLMPAPAISLRDFRTLLRKRTKALSRSRMPPPAAALEENVGDEGQRPQTDLSSPDIVTGNNSTPTGPGKPDDQPTPKEVDTSVASRAQEPNLAGGEGAHLETGGGTASADFPDEKAAAPPQANAEATKNSDVRDENEKKKKELEEKLLLLNERKHQLVQALKQILNAEEEVKKRNMQASGVRDLEGESHLHQMHITSPSAASPLGRTVSSPFQHNMAPLTNRANYPAPGQGPATSNTLTGVMASPSRFALPGHQGHPSSLLSVSVSGTHYAASSPSPAASGGTSAFRDGRLTSPSWN